MKILVINSGSSSLKYKLFDLSQKNYIAKGMIEHIGEKGSLVPDHYSGLKSILSRIRNVDVVGHRVVHGAEAFKEPVVITEAVMRKIRQCCAIAPLHNPANLEGILACKKLLPGVKQVAVFDTAFHQTIPDFAYTYGLPYGYYKKLGIRKYGFHGTSHEYVAQEAARLMGKPLSRLKIITCHLGNGASITAVNKGRSVDTSMGFTPLEGLVMGTRCGDIDPALVTYLMRKKHLTISAMEEVLNKKSGLKGISGLSNDLRVLKIHSQKNPRVRLALAVFIYRIRKYIGSYAAVMQGVDALVFTAGIGEHQPRIRQGICQGLFQYLKQVPRVLVIPTDEELMIARLTFKLVGGGSDMRITKHQIPNTK